MTLEIGEALRVRERALRYTAEEPRIIADGVTLAATTASGASGTALSPGRRDPWLR
jgi:hypothetical protein